MPEVIFSAFRTRGVYVDYNAFVRTIDQGFRSDIAPDLVSLCNHTVSHWKKQPEFVPEVETTEDGVSVAIRVQGDASKIWFYLNYGVEGHTIKPNPARRWKRIKARYRKMKGEYVRDPRVIGRMREPMALKFKGIGGEDVYRKSVEWKGIEPRDYIGEIGREYNDTFRRKIENIKRRAVRAAQQ
jgi:hypothetical protein